MKTPKPETTGHTPGPWHVLDHGNELIAPGDGGAMVAKVVKTATWPRSESEHAANAHLIAAAPDLLAALERFAGCSQVRDIVSGDTELAQAVFDARAAIQKAKGLK